MLIDKKTVTKQGTKHTIKLMYFEELNSYKVTAAKGSNIYLIAGGMNKETALQTFKNQ